ncbi:MAG TPA: hypothetical protein VM870_07160 [Pyrinomonadaceae bacterium]|nr:hypothetical protein [Pyrinomonadaceae bacterium]
MEVREGVSSCPACGSATSLRRWRDLSDEQQEVVRKLPATALYPIAERAARHAWCTTCWHEATGDTPQRA